MIRCALASVLPYRSIWSALKSSERSGSSALTWSAATRGPCQRPRNCVRWPKMDLLLATAASCLDVCARWLAGASLPQQLGHQVHARDPPGHPGSHEGAFMAVLRRISEALAQG